MKISNTTPNYVNQTYTTNSNTAAQNLKATKTAEEVPTDSINLSGRTQDLQKVSKSLDLNAADRQKYVADIKQQVENNQYNVNAEQVAEKIVGTFMDNFG